VSRNLYKHPFRLMKRLVRLMAMGKKTLLAAVFISALLVSMLLGCQVVKLANANFEPQPSVYIEPDGNVTGTDKIIQDGNNYVLTADADIYICVLRSNAVLTEQDTRFTPSP